MHEDTSTDRSPSRKNGLCVLVGSPSRGVPWEIHLHRYSGEGRVMRIGIQDDIGPCGVPLFFRCGKFAGTLEPSTSQQSFDGYASFLTHDVS